LKAPHHENIEEMHLTSCLDACFEKIDWSVVGAAMERWNMVACTFFFLVGEMTMFFEEVIGLMSLNPEVKSTFYFI